jgi:hypothetical protein
MKWMKTCIETHKPTPKPTRPEMKMRCNPLFYWDQRIFIVPGTGSEPFFSILFSFFESMLKNI